jgi:hypothetical protein
MLAMYLKDQSKFREDSIRYRRPRLVPDKSAMMLLADLDVGDDLTLHPAGYSVRE